MASLKPLIRVFLLKTFLLALTTLWFSEYMSDYCPSPWSLVHPLLGERISYFVLWLQATLLTMSIFNYYQVNLTPYTMFFIISSHITYGAIALCISAKSYSEHHGSPLPNGALFFIPLVTLYPIELLMTILEVEVKCHCHEKEE